MRDGPENAPRLGQGDRGAEAIRNIGDKNLISPPNKQRKPRHNVVQFVPRSALDQFRRGLMALAYSAEQPRAQVACQHNNPWAEYENRKRELHCKGLAPERYAIEIRKVCEELGL
jgi:hypothetical protein